MPDTLSYQWQELARAYSLRPATKVWVVEGGWTSGFAETLRNRFRKFSDIEIHSFGHYLEIFSLTVEQRETGKVSHLGNVTGSGLPPHPFVLIICSACFREVSVNFAPLNIRATSSVRSSPLTPRMLVRVRPAESFFSIT